MNRWTSWGFALAAALAIAPAAQADDKETKREAAATSPQAGEPPQRSDDPARGDTARGAMNQTESTAKQTPPDSSTPRVGGTDGTATGAAGATASSGDADSRKQHDASVPSRHDNTDLIQKLWSSNVAEIHMAKVAKDRARSDGVKEFADQMEKDHGEMKDALEKLADKRGLKLDEDAAVAPHKAHTEQMEKLEGAQFDRHYTQMMVKMHAKDRKDGQAALKRAKQSGDHELAEVLKQADQKMAQHHRLAQQLEKSKGQRMGRRASEAGASAERGADRAGARMERGAERTGEKLERGAEKTGEAAKDATR